jgi:hypothetical protein
VTTLQRPAKKHFSPNEMCRRESWQYAKDDLT